MTSKEKIKEEVLELAKGHLDRSNVIIDLTIQKCEEAHKKEIEKVREEWKKHYHIGDLDLAYSQLKEDHTKLQQKLEECKNDKKKLISGFEKDSKRFFETFEENKKLKSEIEEKRQLISKQIDDKLDLQAEIERLKKEMKIQEELAISECKEIDLEWQEKIRKAIEKRRGIFAESSSTMVALKELLGEVKEE